MEDVTVIWNQRYCHSVDHRPRYAKFLVKHVPMCRECYERERLKLKEECHGLRRIFESQRRKVY